MCKVGIPGRLAGIMLLAFALVAGLTQPAYAQSEDGVKAAFLYNFAKFTTWPASAFSGSADKVVVGFIGAGPLADTFSQAVAGKNVNGREIDVKKLGGAGEASGCHVVFVGTGSAGAVVSAVKGKPVLTVGDSAAFADGGGMVGFAKDGAKVVFVLNLDAASAAGLKVDPKLKAVAKSVKGA